ncbi:uncharacterized protein EDB93DRAFT_1178428 [Suillus bovinus]|uniref:uncharacterized protein n=1 Tax=Suillus bovinus TaxID=48563 RepID=UPI001B86CD96|nr:uncharacterized protein EDB93DRAFT_1178428 [Suillus bovinus]KAG2131286.1 hypothetical protein EDB93DRAFT_1178428 [Suillus bovinus]
MARVSQAVVGCMAFVVVSVSQAIGMHYDNRLKIMHFLHISYNSCCTSFVSLYSISCSRKAV